MATTPRFTGRPLQLLGKAAAARGISGVLKVVLFEQMGITKLRQANLGGAEVLPVTVATFRGEKK